MTMIGVFEVLHPDQIDVRLTFEMKLYDARQISDQIKGLRQLPWPLAEFVRQLDEMVAHGEVRFTPEPRHLERPDG